MKEVIEMLFKQKSERLDELKECKEKIKNIENAIVTLQNVCDHKNFIETGRDSHYSYKQCVVCQYETKC